MARAQGIGPALLNGRFMTPCSTGDAQLLRAICEGVLQLLAPLSQGEARFAPEPQAAVSAHSAYGLRPLVVVHSADESRVAHAPSLLDGKQAANEVRLAWRSRSPDGAP